LSTHRKQKKDLNTTAHFKHSLWSVIHILNFKLLVTTFSNNTKLIKMGAINWKNLNITPVDQTKIKMLRLYIYLYMCVILVSVNVSE